jgi:5-methylcytosine-specific restriction protein A
VTGPTQVTREIVYARAGNVCEICYRPPHMGSLHHRKARGMGGSRAKWINLPANLMLVCGSGTTGCHGKIESYRERSFDAGWLLRWGEDAEVKPFVDGHGDWWRLDNDGGKTRTGGGEAL